MMGFGGKFEGSFVLTAGTEIGLIIGIPGKPTRSYETSMNYAADDWGWGGYNLPGMTSGGSAGGGNSRATINGNRGNSHTSDPRGGGGALLPVPDGAEERGHRGESSVGRKEERNHLMVP